jgi:3-oxoacyl-[acyl-carrier-protein] synthase II
MMNRRAVVTGIGVISSPGAGKDKYWSGIISGRSFIRRITRFDASLTSVKIASEIDDAILQPFLTQAESPVDSLENRILLYTAIAARLALNDSQITTDDFQAERGGIVLGTSTGPTPAAVTAFYRTKDRTEQKNRCDRSQLWMHGFPAYLVRSLSLEHGLRGYCNVVSTGCAAGADAIGVAMEAISWGLSDVMLAIGAEAPIEPSTIQAFDNIRALSHCNDDPEHASRPFDLKRDGFVIGEGAAVLVLEEKGQALLRGAKIYGEISGYTTTSDAHHMTAPRDDLAKATLAARRALHQAGVAAEDVDYVSAHATSTPIGDKLETQLVKNVLGRAAYKVPISSLKSIIGHSSGAAGAMQAAANCLILENQVIFPTVNLEFPDPECDLDYVPNKPRAARVECILQQTFGFSGKNSLLVLSKA